jgi:hypothetical protein
MSVESVAAGLCLGFDTKVSVAYITETVEGFVAGVAR